MAFRHASHHLDPNASETFIIRDYDPYVKVFCDGANKKIHGFLEDSKADYKLSVQTEMGKPLLFHTVYKKMAIWVRAERPSLNDRFSVNFYATRKPIGTYSSEVPTAVRFENANYYDNCKHYGTCCPNQPVTSALDLPFNGTPLRECLIHDWLFYDSLGWQGMLGDPEEIYPEKNYTTP